MKTTINMFQSGKFLRHRAKLSGRSFTLPLVAIFVSAAVFGFYFFLYARGKALDAAISPQNSPSGQNTEANAKAQALQSQIAQYRIYEDQLDTAQQALTAAPEFDRGIFDTINSVRPANVTIRGLSVTDTVVSIFCTTTGNIPPAGYAEALDGLPAFESVGYTGFQDSGNGTYSFKLTCALPLSAGGDAQ